MAVCDSISNDRRIATISHILFKCAIQKQTEKKPCYFIKDNDHNHFSPLSFVYSVCVCLILDVYILGIVIEKKTTIKFKNKIAKLQKTQNLWKQPTKFYVDMAHIKDTANSKKSMREKFIRGNWEIPFDNTHTDTHTHTDRDRLHPKKSGCVNKQHGQTPWLDAPNKNKQDKERNIHIHFNGSTPEWTKLNC